jgi:hypothetical protein
MPGSKSEMEVLAALSLMELLWLEVSGRNSRIAAQVSFFIILPPASQVDGYFAGCSILL